MNSLRKTAIRKFLKIIFYLSDICYSSLNDKKVRSKYLVLGPGASKKHFGNRVALHGYLLTSFPGRLAT